MNLNESIKHNWNEEVVERTFHGKPEGKWVVEGWYENEKEAFYTAEKAWNKKQQEGWDIEDNTPKTLTELAEGDGSFDIFGDDYFRWNVTTPHWYLHKDGTWWKLLCKYGTDHKYESAFGPKLMSGEYGSREEAEETLKNSPKPSRFENYQEHLDAADEPVSLESWNSLKEKLNES